MKHYKRLVLKNPKEMILGVMVKLNWNRKAKIIRVVKKNEYLKMNLNQRHFLYIENEI